MSKFHTNIPVDLDASFSKLPVGSRVVNYSLDQAKRELVVEWEHDQLKTPYSVPIPFALEDVATGKMPNMATDLRVVEPAKTEQNAQPLTLKKGIDKDTVKGVKSRK